MAATQALLFDDAELLWGRAQYHLAEYQRQPDPWRFEELQDPASGEWTTETAAYGGRLLRWYLWFHILAGWTLPPLMFAGLSGLIRVE